MSVSVVSCGLLYTSQPTSPNTIIFTNDWLLMFHMGPKVSSKTRPLFAMLASATIFNPKLQKTDYFYKVHQLLFEKGERLNIEFVPCLHLEYIRNFEKCSLVFDDSFEKIHQDKKVKIAFDGRYKRNQCIFVKQNLFDQSKCLRSIDLNATHVDLIKSPRNVQQIAYFGRQLNKLEFIRACYPKAISSSYGDFWRISIRRQMFRWGSVPI